MCFFSGYCCLQIFLFFPPAVSHCSDDRNVSVFSGDNFIKEKHSPKSNCIFLPGSAYFNASERDFVLAVSVCAMRYVHCLAIKWQGAF